MSITYEVLGEPGRDNALLATVNTGQSQHRLLFDCGEGCLDRVSRADIQVIEVLFFSHFHIDHVAGFDSFFRSNWYRADTPVQIFGPKGARKIIHHRMQGVSWNLVEGASGEVRVTELDGPTLATSRYLACEGFAQEHRLDEQSFDGVVYRGHEFRVEARAMRHGIPSMAYVVRESDRSNVDMETLAAEGYTPGPWLKQIKDSSIPPESEIEVAGTRLPLGDLRDRLLVHQPGESIAYLTDFCLESEQDEDELAGFLGDCKVLICENNFRDADAELAQKSYHMTSTDVGRLAARVQPEKLVVFHVSDRYTLDEWKEQLADVRGQFERAEFPAHWPHANDV
jgi:ribonuclease Z